ncbi:MAG TPA: hypothetical protein VIV11_01480 [Kofleriaceae bacterium]
MRLSVYGLTVALAGCTIDTGYEPPPPPPWGVPLTGGTMTVTRDGSRVVVADPDRDRVVIANLDSERVEQIIELGAGNEPGRAIEDGAGRIHVALRGSGELLTITGDAHELRYVCGEPRGLAWTATDDLVHVACATGELVSLPPGGGAATRALRIERDLRDIVVLAGDRLAVSKFRSAELLSLDEQGNILVRTAPAPVQRFDFSGGFSATVPANGAVAWRTLALPSGAIAMVHQRRLGTTLRMITGGYGGTCSKAAESSLTIIGAIGNPPLAVALPTVLGALPIDIAVHPTTGDFAIVSAGDETVTVVAASQTTTPDQGGCSQSSGASRQIVGHQVGAPSSVAYRPNGQLLIYYPEADGISIVDGASPRGISFGGRPQTDVGRTLFHQQTQSGLACASCHPEGGDDGGVWKFDKLGLRRTQNLGGGLLARAPYHWSADMPTLHSLVENVFTQRMSGDSVAPEQMEALGKWLDRVPAPRGIVVDAAAVTRGEALFNSSETGCRTCHTGALYTNNLMANVGTDATFKVPSLIGVGGRAPFMHDGCASTLRDRFGACGGGDSHGHTSQLTSEQLDDLVAYLESL